MMSGYRSVIIATLGLLTLAASPSPKGVQPESSVTQTDSQKDLGRIAAALEKLPNTPAPDTGCKAGQDKRASELCAQWKAADAAKDTAALATWQTILSAFGLIGLLVSLYSTRRALSVANETHLAFIKAEDANLVFNFPDGIQNCDGSFSLDMMVTNTGRSAATVHKVEICNQPIIMETVFIPGQQTRLPAFASVPVHRNLDLKVVFSSPFVDREVSSYSYRVLPPKGHRKTFWAISIDWEAQET